MSDTTVPTADNGRGLNGRFQPGNRAATGNPANKRAQQIRQAVLAAVRPIDIRRIIAALLTAAQAGDVVAAREVLDRTIGKPAQAEVLERLA